MEHLKKCCINYHLDGTEVDLGCENALMTQPQALMILKRKSLNVQKF